MSGTAPTEAVERALGPADAAACVPLSAEAGWNQNEDDWRLMLGWGQAFGIKAEGRLVASALTLPYASTGGGYAWISMVLVTARFRHRGIATRLMQACLDWVDERGLVPVLDATPVGRPVYLKLGFSDGVGMTRLEAPVVGACDAHSPDGVTIEPISDVAGIVAFDASRCGLDRSSLLAHLRGREPDGAFVARTGDGRVVGYVLGRRGRLARHIGPLVADTPEIARALLARVLPGGRVFIDLFDGQNEIAAWLAALGFTAQRPFTRMHRGAEPPPHSRSLLCAAGPELG
jgi:GNAT superfamily N-acetyltransferase